MLASLRRNIRLENTREIRTSTPFVETTSDIPDRDSHSARPVTLPRPSTLTMLLASLDVLRPVAGPRPLVVEQSAYAQLLGGGAVPAGPVPGAGGLVAEDAVQPVAVVGLYRRVRLALTVAVVRAPRIVAALGDAAVLTGEHETVGTVEELGTAVHALPVAVAVVDVAHHPRLRLAGVLLLLLLAIQACKRQRPRPSFTFALRPFAES